MVSRPTKRTGRFYLPVNRIAQSFRH
jgi:hypothetical protein